MKKTLVTFIIMILILASWVTTVQALSFTVTLKPSATVVEKGGTVEVIAALSNIDAGNGINSLLATLEYDRNVFETITSDSESHLSKEITGIQGWDKLLYNQDKGKFVTDRDTFAKTDMDAIKITLKVKESAATGSTTITIKDISASNGQQDINAQNASCTVTVKEKSATPNPDDNTTTTKPTATVDYQTVSNGTKVIIKSNSTLKALEGWELSSDKKQLSKVYTANYKGTISITDENGNVSDPITIDTKLGNTAQDITKPTASIKYTKDSKGVVTVTITASEPIQAVTGWTLSADKKTLTKQYTKNTTETITIVDLAGNKSDAIKIVVDTSLPNGGNDVQGGSGDTKSPDQLPKAGVAFIIPVIAIITVAGAVAFVRYKSMEY